MPTANDMPEMMHDHGRQQEHAGPQRDASEVTEHCALCGMEITGEPVVRVVDGREVHFDTEDCARLYEVAAAQGLLDVILAERPERQRGTLAGLTKTTATAYFTLDGMWCASCASAAEKVLLRMDGVDEAQVSFAAGKGRIDYDPKTTDLDAVVHRLEQLGYRPVLTSTAEEVAQGKAEEHLLIQVLVAFAFGMQVMILYLVRLYPAYRADDFSQSVRTIQYLVWLLATPALFYGGVTILRGAWRSLITRTPNMDTLVALGTLSAYSYSAWAALVGGHPTYFDSVTMIVQFVMLGRYFEVAGGARARKDVRGLMELQPTRAWLKGANGSLDEVPASRIAPEDVIVVKPGERVPVDAKVLDGAAHADESLLTGESRAVAKAEGDTVWAGTLLEDGSVTARALNDVGTSRLSGIRSLVQHTLETKAPVERMADRVSAYLTFVILAIAVLTGVGWALAGRPASEALITAVAVLVVACPCALGLATPLAVSASLGSAARAGVLVRNSAALETGTTVDTVVFDKTGTVTRARLQVAAVRAAADVDPSTLICTAAAVEQYSEHPLARAIVSACPAPPEPARGFESHRGVGAVAVLERDGARVAVGQESLMPHEPPSKLIEQANEFASEGETIVWIALGDAVLGFVALRDEIDPTAASAISALETDSRQALVLSGDSEDTTRAVAHELGLSRFEARLSPEMKADFLADLQSSGGRVAMVGDGVNDAPALARADLSITVAGGSDVAGETSDVVLARRDLTLVPWFLRLSDATRRIIRENIGWAIGYNLVAVPLAASGLITPGIAAAAMATSSLIVVGNSLRLRRGIPAVTSTAALASQAGNTHQ